MQDQNQIIHESPVTLADELALFDQYEEATPGQRLANYIIDLIAMRFTIAFGTVYMMNIVLEEFFFDFLLTLGDKGRYSWEMLLLRYIGLAINFIIYYTICEKLFRGYTLGKLITGTRAIREDGKELTFKDALSRSLCRIIPFEQLSIWGGNGLWHDNWTKTRVVKAR